VDYEKQARHVFSFRMARLGGLSFGTRIVDSTRVEDNLRDMSKFIDSIEKTFKDGVEIIKIKNADYAKGDDPFLNFKFAELLGLSVEQAILLRVTDKIARINNLLDKEPAVVGESMEDSLLDVINYLAILKAYRELDND